MQPSADLQTGPLAGSRPVTSVRDAREEDWPAIWPIVREVVRAADTFA